MACGGTLDENDLVAATLLALDRRLESVRREQLARNRSILRELSSEQLQEVERLTSAITGKIFRELATELRQSAAESDGGRVSEALSLVLGLA